MEGHPIQNYYSHEIEFDRLELEVFKLEGLRAKEIIQRYIQKDKLEILDIGGGAGYYSFWLQKLGHSVSLVDLSPTNIDLAKKQAGITGIDLVSYEVGNATKLDYNDQQFDLVLLMGPLYHLIDRDDRISALKEAKRVLKPGGILIAAFISRYASLVDGLQRDLIIDDRFFELLKKDLQAGVHLNETDNLEYFTTAYFHTPEEMVSELSQSGLIFKKLIAVEGLGWAVNDFSNKQADPSYWSKVSELLKLIESDMNVIAASPHVIGIGEK